VLGKGKPTPWPATDSRQIVHLFGNSLAGFKRFQSRVFHSRARTHFRRKKQTTGSGSSRGIKKRNGPKSRPARLECECDCDCNP